MMSLEDYEERNLRGSCEICSLPLAHCLCQSEPVERWDEEEMPLVSKKKIGLSKTPPRNEARPLGLPKPRHFRPTKLNRSQKEKACIENQKSLASSQSPATPPVTYEPAKPVRSQKIMTLTYKSLNRRGSQAIYTGLRTAIRIPVSAFEGKIAPDTLEIEGAFAAPRQPRVPREKMTAEEKSAAKLARKNAPKPTLAERVARAEKRAAALKAELAAESASM